MSVEIEHPDNLDPLPASADRWVYWGLLAMWVLLFAALVVVACGRAAG